MHNLVTRRNHNPSDLLPWVGLTGMLYVPEIGKRHSFCCGEADTLGSACFHHLEGSFPTGGEFGALLSTVLAVGLGTGPRAPYYARSAGGGA
jgi:hypothetical protein